MARFTLAFFWILAVAQTLPGQAKLVLPPGAATKEATGSTNLPFGRSTPALVQTAYDARLFPGAMTVRSLAMRLDGGATASAKTVEFDLRLSTMPTSVLGIQSDFATNRGSDEKTVIARKITSLPALGQAATPNPFLVTFLLEAPFVYTPAANSLLVEFRVYGQQPTAYTLDSSWVCESPTQYFGPPGCGPQGGPVLHAVCETLQVMWGRSFYLAVKDAKPGALTALLLGTLESGVWGGITIPHELSPYGAPGCWLAVDPLAVQSKAADGSGFASYGFSLPSNPWFLGQWVRFQGVGLDAGANALGVVASEAGKVVVCGWELVARVWATSVTGSAGNREVGVGAILEVGS